jgi:ribosomal protein S18 acetylase RimI-like enzyme
VEGMNMAENSYELRELSWDTALFEMKMGEILLQSGNAGSGYIPEIWCNTIKTARRQSYRFLLCQLDTQYQETANELVRQGAITGDTLVTLELNLRDIPELAATAVENIPSKLQIMAAEPGDLPVISEIAADSFSHSRIYQDPHFDQTKARHFYPKWLRDSFGINEMVYILKDKNPGVSILGFISLQYQEVECRIVIRLIAVHEHHRGSGYGQVMMDWLIREALKKGFDRIQVGTQAGNTAALRLYEKNGFRPIGAKYRFHIWLD